MKTCKNTGQKSSPGEKNVKVGNLLFYIWTYHKTYTNNWTRVRSRGKNVKVGNLLGYMLYCIDISYIL